jgi:hypothetical protein
MNRGTCCLRARSESLSASFTMSEFVSVVGGTRAVGSCDSRAEIRMCPQNTASKLPWAHSLQFHCAKAIVSATGVSRYTQPRRQPQIPIEPAAPAQDAPATHPAGASQIAAEVLIVDGLFPRHRACTISLLVDDLVPSTSVSICRPWHFFINWTGSPL